MTRLYKTTGFTLVELMLSMVFISVLLLSIAMLMFQITSIYNKGITIRAVNEAGQLITSDIQRTLNTSNPQEIDRVPLVDTPATTGGRLCVGTTVYAWNKGEFLESTSAFNKDTDGKTDIRLVKFTTDGTKYCTEVGGIYPPLPVTGITKVLDMGDNNLAVQKINITDTPVADDGTQTMYTVSLSIGTNELSVINGDGCKIPESVVDDEYCAVNEFNFVARAGNK